MAEVTHHEPAPSWLGRLARFFLPVPCLACGQLPPAGAGQLGLCRRCRGQLVPVPEPACHACGRPLAAAEVPAGYLCGGCRHQPPAYDRLLAAWSYQPPLVAVIHGLKFRRLDYLGSALAAELVRRFGAELAAAEVVVPVPLHWRRQLGRGFNQAERIAAPLAAQLGRPLVPGLRRARHAPPQSRSDRRHRLSNLANNFRSHDDDRLARACVLLVDDVVTTGATLHAAATALKAAGARQVLAVAAGWTPPPG